MVIMKDYRDDAKWHGVDTGIDEDEIIHDDEDDDDNGIVIVLHAMLLSARAKRHHPVPSCAMRRG